MLDPDGQRISVVALDSTALAEMGQNDRVAQDLPLETIRRMLVGGIASVSVCRLDDLDAELFSYAGAGTFFSRERYTEVRSLTLEDFHLAANLLKQGETEGYLAVRDADAIERLLGHGFGVFVEGRYLAGFCALLPYADSAVGEIAGLYTVTRFAGEGVGGQLVRHALEEAGRSGLHSVFACTTSQRVEGFFRRQGFRSAFRVTTQQVYFTGLEAMPFLGMLSLLLGFVVIAQSLPQLQGLRNHVSVRRSVPRVARYR